MRKTMTPIFSMAVVMALALAAVFGSMSLAPNPAQAQTTPNDTLTIYTGLSHVYDAGPLFSGVQYEGASDLDSVGPVTTVNNVSATEVAGDDDKATFTISYGGTFPTGAPYITATLVFELAESEVVGTDAETRRVEVTVMNSMPATRNMTTDDPAAPVDIEDLDTLYTEYEQKHPINVWTSGTGTGEIVGYQVFGGATTTDEPMATDGFTVTDALPGTTADSLELIANVGTDGMVALKGEATVPATATVALSAVPICQTALNEFGPCVVGGSAAAHGDSGFEVTVVQSMMAEATVNDLPAQTLMVEDDPDTMDETENMAMITLIGNADPVADYFTDGTGNGKITRWVVRSSNQFAVTGRASTSDNVLMLTAREVGRSVITVFPVDGFTIDATREAALMKTLEVRVVAEAEAPVAPPQAPNAPSVSSADMTGVDATGDTGRVTVSWADPLDDRIDGWQYSYMQDSNGDDVWNRIFSGRARSVTISGLTVGTEYTVKVRALVGDVMGAVGMVTVTPTAATAPPGIVNFSPTLAALSNDPGKATRYTIKFNANGPVHAGSDELVIEMEDFGFPGSVDADDVTIRVQSTDFNEPSNPESVTVSGEKLRIVLGDTNPDTDTIEGISMGDNVTVTIAQGAGLSNPTEGKSYEAVITGGGLKKITTDAYMVPLIIELGEDDGGQGDSLVLIGKGFKNGHTLTFWLDRNMNNVPGDSGESTLCSATVGSDDSATCTIEVSNPPFTSGGVSDAECSGATPDCNFVNAFDGAGNIGSAISGRGATAKPSQAGMDGLIEDQTFELKAAISITPETGSVGDTIQVQMSDYPSNATVKMVTIAGIHVAASGSVNAEGNGSFTFTIPNNVPQGIEKLVVVAENAAKMEADADTKLIIGGPSIRVTPGSVLANQRISVVASGFTAGARVCCVDPDGSGPDRAPEIKVGNVVIPSSRINGGNTVTVDNGGTWAASINLPMDKALTEEGTKELRVTDSKGRIGTVDVTIPSRTITVTPASGRVGTLAVVSGTNFPARNDEGDSFSVSIVYQASTGSTTTVSATPDASGKFSEQVRIPTGSAIPSTNNILVSFTAGGQKVDTSITHEVPEGIISLSDTSGAAGSTITVNGEGFNSIVPVSSVKLGDIDLTPAPRPRTTHQGTVSFDIVIPGLSEGIHTVEVVIGKTTASVGFTIIEGGAIGAAVLVADGLEPLGENIQSIWYFDNTTKVWSFYSPELDEGNTLTHLIAGETYLIQVKSTVEVILNHKSRVLTCLGDNCWNQEVW